MPFADILVGVALGNFAVPPVIVKLKSETSRLPLAPAELYTSSLKVTCTDELSSLIAMKEITGRTVSPALIVKLDIMPSRPFPEKAKA